MRRMAISRKLCATGVVVAALIMVLWIAYSPADILLTKSLSGMGIPGIVDSSYNDGTERLAKYCNAEIPTRTQPNESISDNWELQYLTINIRHGDRSSIHRLPGTVTPNDPRDGINSPNSLDNITEASNFMNKLNSFHLAALPGNSKRFNFEKNEEKDLKSALHARKTLIKAGAALAPGQLTTRGFMQHIELGRQLHAIYGKAFLSHVQAGSMYVRSTNYARTVQSVSALLITLMPHLSNGKRKVPIRYYPNEEDEIMHGLGVRLSSHSNSSKNVHAQGDHNPETQYFGGCAASVRLAAQQEKVFQVESSLRSELVERIGNQLADKAVGHMADALLPHFCHARPLPCSVVEDKIERGTSTSAVARDALGTFLRARQGPDGLPVRGSHCVNINDLGMIMSEADRHYCERFAGANGGLQATKLSIYPFLREVTGHLVSAALHGTGRKEMVSIFSGHDTVIAPVLAGLGVYTDELCIWPGYASNIVIELWQPKGTHAKGHHDEAMGNPTPSFHKVFPEKWVPLMPLMPGSYAESFVRVMYNGEDVTQRVPTCVAERTRLSDQASGGAKDRLLARAVAQGLTLCSVDALVEQVASLIGPHKTFAEACAA